MQQIYLDKKTIGLLVLFLMLWMRVEISEVNSSQVKPMAVVDIEQLMKLTTANINTPVKRTEVVEITDEKLPEESKPTPSEPKSVRKVENPKVINIPKPSTSKVVKKSNSNTARKSNTATKKPYTKPNISVDAYIKRWVNVAKMESKKYGIPTSIKLGQGVLESGHGTSELAVNANAHFGIKSTTSSLSNKVKRNFKDRDGRPLIIGEYPAKDDCGSRDCMFLQFRTAWAGWRFHSYLLTSNRYKHLKRYGNDYKKWAYGLQKAGYATDPKYGQKLINIIEKYELYKYD